MKRPLCVVGFPFAATMCAAFLVDGKAALLLSLAALVTAVLAWLAMKKTQVTVAILSVCVAFGVYAWHHQRMIAPFEIAAGHPATVEGLVTEVRLSGRAVDYTLEARFPKVALPDATVILRAYGESQANVGDVIRCRAELAPSNRTYDLNRSIRARGTITEGFIKIESDGYAFSRWRLALRQTLEQNLYAKLPQETAQVLGTMVMKLGDTPHSDIYAHMNRSGVSHLLAISGLHFSVLTTFLLGALRKTFLPRRVPELLTMGAASLFVVLTGFSASIIRAFVMFLIVMLGQFSFRRGDGLNSLGLAALIIAILWPQWTCSLGFWLSFAATMGILVIGSRLTTFFTAFLRGGRVAKGIAGATGTSMGAYLFTLPLLVISSGWISLVALPANVLVSPFVMPALLGGLFCAVMPTNPLPVRAIAWLTDACTRIILTISQLLGEIPFATASLDRGWKLFWLVGAVAVAVLLWRLPRDKKLAMWACMLILCSFGMGDVSATLASRNTVELVTLRDCQSVLLLRGNQAVVLGTPGYYEDAILLEYLRFRQIRSVSMLVAADNGDQIGSALLKLAAAYPPEAILGSDDAYTLELLAHAVKGTPVYPAGYATTQVLDGALLQIDKTTGQLRAEIGGQLILKPGDKADPTAPALLLHEDGTLTLPPGIHPAWEPIGAALFGETRVRLPIG
jgi:competence protein ComEC